MPEIPQCVWEWNGAQWVKQSGPASCNNPPPSRGGGTPEPGEQKIVNCAEVG